MSAGELGATRPNRELDRLAPAFRDAVGRALAACAASGLDAWVYETYRSKELQEIYYARGRTVIPPPKPVTNARSNLYSWHGFGLAVDVISRQKGWNQPESWFADVAVRFRAEGCKWGGDWTTKDLPHFQWGQCKASPSDRARELLATGGFSAVWEAVGALEPAPAPPPGIIVTETPTLPMIVSDGTSAPPRAPVDAEAATGLIQRVLRLPWRF